MKTDNGDVANDTSRNNDSENNHDHDHNTNRHQPHTGPLSTTTTIEATIRICGTSWAPCGYCKGTRSHLSSMKVAATSHDTTTQSGTTTTTPNTMKGSDDGVSTSNNNNMDSTSSTATDTASSSSCIYAIYAKSMTPTVYEELILNGWRRSGNTIYLPINSISCCPNYPIRLHTNEYQLSKSHRKLINRIERILHPTSSSSRQTILTKTNTTNTNDHSTRTSTATAATTASTTSAMKRKFNDSLIQDSPNLVLTPLISTDTTTTIQLLYTNMIQQSNIMKEIYISTEQAIQEYLQQKNIVTTDTNKKSSGVGEMEIPSSNSSWKVQYKPKKINTKHYKSHNHNNNNNPDVMITFVSCICAQMVGQSMSHGIVLDRTQLVQQVVTKLRHDTIRMKNIPHVPIKKDEGNVEEMTSSSPLMIQIVSIDGHYESGQIIIQFRVHPPPHQILLHESTSPLVGVNNKKNTTPTKDTSIMDGCNMHGNDDDDHRNDRILHWWTSLHDSHNHFDRRQIRPMKAVTSSLPLPLPSPPYHITITTIPAHTSALDPRVHQLYFLYQQMVHDEPNPIVQAFSTETNNKNSTAQQISVTENDTMLSENDDPALADQEEVDMNKRNHPTGGHKSGDKAPITFHIDWGQDDMVPVGWMEAVQQMLQQEYNDANDAQLRMIYDAYGAFYEFLVENPFGNVTMLPETMTSSKPALPMGTYHQHYVVHDVLIAVGVIDILPTGLSSVYLFYHPSFAKDVIPMGKYAILKEIEYTKQQRLPYYYLGYYIHSCPKMNYKSHYSPSEILCPITNQWVDVNQAKQMIDRRSPNHHFCKLVPNDTEDMNDSCSASSSSNGSTTQKSAIMHTQHETESQLSLTCDIENRIALLVGYDTPMSLAMLNGPALKLVRPILQDFIRHMGNNVELVQKFIIDLVS